MGRILLSMMLLIAGLTAFGAENESQLTIKTNVDSVSTGDLQQAMSRNIFAEFFGPSFGVGLGFDSRFRPGSVFGYRVGLSLRPAHCLMTMIIIIGGTWNLKVYVSLLRSMRF